jgi:hypothetical protein
VNAAQAPAFEDSAEYADTLATLERAWWDTPERRSAAAKLGWMRRRGLVPPEPWDLFRAAVNAADPRLVRLYVCDVAEAVQHHFQEKYPGDMRTLEVVTVARRYANGEASERERLAAVRRITKLLDERAASRVVRNGPHDCALQAAAFTLAKRLLWAADWGPYWAMMADNPRVTNLMVIDRYTEVFATFARKETQP